MAGDTLIAPRRGDAFVNGEGIPLERPKKWMEEVSRRVNQDFSTSGGLQTQIDALDVRVTELEPAYTVITSANSPYSISNNEYVLADMSISNIIIVLPGAGRHFVSRSGASNTLTLQGTVEGETDPLIVADGDAPALAFIGSEYRYV